MVKIRDFGSAGRQNRLSNWSILLAYVRIAKEVLTPPQTKRSIFSGTDLVYQRGSSPPDKDRCS
jgi:hypothetical protein